MKTGTRRLRRAFVSLVATPVLLGSVVIGVDAVQNIGAGAAPKEKPASASARPVSSGEATTAAASTVAYWTPERMASAKPAPVPTVSKEAAASAATAGPDGDPVTAPGHIPNAVAEEAATGQDTKVASGDAQATCSHCDIPFTRWQYAAKYVRYPVSTVAKVFFSNNGGNYVCSGSTIYTNVVWTAGHCIANTDYQGQWSTNVLVCPSYDNGVNPAVGCWSATNLWTFSQWKDLDSFEWDMGAIVTSTCGTVHCTSIANRTGYLGYAYNQPRDVHWFAWGYPAGSPFNGMKIQVAASQFGYVDTDGNNQGGPDSSAMGNDLTGGSSGGPWLLNYGTSNWLNGHNDWRHTAEPKEMNSPYFDSRFCTLINSAGRPCS